MKGARRKAILAAVSALVGTAVTVPMVVSGTASAQAGSRLCGRYWQSEDPVTHVTQVVTKIYEVEKDFHISCNSWKPGEGELENFPEWELTRKWNSDLSLATWRTDDIGMERCEDWKNRFPHRGGLGGMNLVFDPDYKWPANDQNDICDNMERTTLNEGNGYWLHWDGTSTTVDFLYD